MPRKANTTAAPDERNDNTDEPVTKLAQVDNPAKITNDRIEEIAGEHGDESDPEQSANADVADALKQAKAEAKSKDETTPSYFHGQGGAAGI